MNNSTDQAQFCPECSSSLVKFSLLGGEAECEACGWKGTQKDMMTVPFSHGMGSPEQVMTAFVSDLRNLVSSHIALPFGMFLKKWGFLPEDPKEMKVVLARYVTAMARASVRAVFDERAALEKEKVRART